MNILRQLFEFWLHPKSSLPFLSFLWERTNWWQWGIAITVLTLFTHGAMTLRPSAPTTPSPTAPQSIPR